MQNHSQTQTRLGSSQSTCSDASCYTHCCPLCGLSAGSDLACRSNNEDPDTPTQFDTEDREEEPVAPLASTNEDLGSDLDTSTGRVQLCVRDVIKLFCFFSMLHLLFAPVIVKPSLLLNLSCAHC